MKDHLTLLINHLQTKLDQQDSSLQTIKNPVKLLNTLKHLQTKVVGMHHIKDCIARQTFYLMDKLQKGERSLKMLNTMLLGNPGTGKTILAIIMAEIWQHLGFLDQAVKKNTNNTYMSKIMAIEQEVLQLYLVFGMILLSSLYNHIIQPIYQQFGVMVTITTLLCVGVLLFLVYNNVEQQMMTMEDESPIVITSRSDFIGYYVGSTDKKTEALLLKHRGKVLFIDEMYSLVNGTQDFGPEALASLNRFLSEHPDEIVVIGAGYEDALNDTVFKIQPGLKRRFMWHFTIDNYNAEELFDIFQLQLEKENYKMNEDDYDDIKEMIMFHDDLFVNQAGDTEKLAFYAQLNHTMNHNNNKQIGLSDVKHGLKELNKTVKRHLLTDKPNDVTKLKELMKQIM